MNQPSDGPLVSYAQNREDLFLWGLLGHRPNGNYIDVGCNHERLHSVTRLFYERGWSGLNIDANEAMASEYSDRARDVFVSSGVGSEPGLVTFRLYPEHDGLSTFDQDVMALYESSGRPYSDRELKVRTLDDITTEVGLERADFLKIDVEGMEAHVLRGTDLETMRPGVIILEASRQADCNEILLPLGYRIEFFDGLNTYYVDESQPDISIHNYSDRVLAKGFYTDREWTHLNTPPPNVPGQQSVDSEPSSTSEPVTASGPPESAEGPVAPEPHPFLEPAAAPEPARSRLRFAAPAVKLAKRISARLPIQRRR